MKKNALTITVLTLALVICLARASLCADDGWVPLFDGKTLDGWKVNGGTASYKVEDGVIVGTTVEGSPNTFLCKGDYKDFVLELDVKCDPRLNSGVQVRSHVYEKDDANPENRKRAGVVYGPQCEIARKETGTAGRFYDEGRRGKWLAEIKPEAKDAFRDDGWNRYRIVVQGNRYRSWINGIAASDFTDDVDKGGFIGLQVHGIAKDQGPYQVRWRNVRIKELKPGEEVSSAEPPEGFKAVFNGRDLTGWEGSPKYWSVEDGCLTGKADGTLKFNRFLTWRGGTRQELRAAGQGQGLAHRQQRPAIPRDRAARPGRIGRHRLPVRRGGQQARLQRHALRRAGPPHPGPHGREGRDRPDGAALGGRTVPAQGVPARRVA